MYQHHHNKNVVRSTTFGYVCILFIVAMLTAIEVYNFLNEFRNLNQTQSRVDDIKNATLYRLFKLFNIKNHTRGNITLKTI